MTGIAALREVLDEAAYGGKAAQLSAAMQWGLPVPHGVALDWRVLDAFIADDADPIAAIAGALDLSAGVAVRSSAIGEDLARASFAGLHETILNVRSKHGLAQALRAVHASARTKASLAYRRRHQLDVVPRMAAVVQVLVQARVAGVLFTRDPLTGRDIRVVEASWGLGRAVVDGMVTPDSYRIARDGCIIERRLGKKDVAIRRSNEGEGVSEQRLGSGSMAELCLRDEELFALEQLASRCEGALPGPQDLEFAFDVTGLHLLQRRPISRFPPVDGLSSDV